MHKAFWHLSDAWLAFLEVFKRQPLISPDNQWLAWKNDIKRIHDETVYVFENRYVFRRLREIMAGKREVESEGGFFFEWVRGLYGRDMVIAVGRELDQNTEVINLIQLMYQLTRCPEVITRDRFIQMLDLKPGNPDAWPPETDSILLKINQKWFTDNIGAGDKLDPALIQKDRNWLEKQCKTVMKYRHKMVAHRSPMQLTLTKLGYPLD